MLLDRIELVTADTVAIFPYSGTESLDADYCVRLGRLLAELLAIAVRDGRLDARSGLVANLHRPASSARCRSNGSSRWPT